VYVAVQLGQIELALLFLLMLCLALLDTPVPRVWALAAAALVAVQNAALHSLHDPQVTFPEEEGASGLGGAAGVIAVIVVPALGAGLFGVVCWYLARANAQVRRATPSAATSPPAAAPRQARAPASRAARPATARRDPAQPAG
jgi:hypothetical protein